MSYRNSMISISLTPKLLERINKYVTGKHIPQKTLALKVMPYQLKFYKSIKRGMRSNIFMCIIDSFLKMLEKEEYVGYLFHSKGELVRNALIFNKFLNKDSINYSISDIPGGWYINGNIPIGNIYHPDGDWKDKHNKEDLLRYNFLEKIHNKVCKHFSLSDIVNNFGIFYKAYKDGVFDDSVLLEKKIQELKTVINNSNSN